MNAWMIVYLPTGKALTNKDGSVITVRANTERGAKMQATKLLSYVDWNLHHVYPLEG